MKPLHKKLGRDLWRVKGQASAITVVIALGVMMLVMMDGLVSSLENTKQAYYERYRLADIFAPAQRIPAHLISNMANIDGVVIAEGRVNGQALIDLPNIALPLPAQAVSLPDTHAPHLNDIYVSAGRKLNPQHKDEIILLESFAQAHHLKLGGTLSATLNGARHQFNIVGFAQAPEFLYTTPPNELMPDDTRFAVIWMSQAALSAAYDLEGAYNEILLRLDKNIVQQSIISTIDRVLAPYGARGAYGIKEHLSDRFVSEEIAGLKSSRQSIPPIFLGVAAFLLYMVISRMVQAERGQIGLLKAFGYTNMEISLHYYEFVLVIALLGALLGCLLGMIAGHSLSVFYQFYFKFPFLIFNVEPRTFIIGFVTSILAASAGGILVLNKIFVLTPAESMRPPTPIDYSQIVHFPTNWMRHLDQPSKMVLRAVMRQPWRTLSSVLGISVGMALAVAMLGVMGGFNKTLDINFSVIDRSDVTVSFIHPLSPKAVLELGRLQGVLQVEPFRIIPAVLTHGLYRYRGVITGLNNKPSLYRAVDDSFNEVYIRDDGIVLAQALAKILHIQAGDILTIEAQEASRPVIQLPVIALANPLLGAPAYYNRLSLSQSLHEGERISGAYLRINSQYSTQIYQKLKKMPVVAGVSLRSEARASFEKMMNTGAGAMRYIMAGIAAIITFGIVYNNARISFAERMRDLSSLRVIGLYKNEASFVLLGELGIITLLALPLGSMLGYFLSDVVATAFSTDIYRVPNYFSASSYGIAALAVILATLASAWLVKRDIDTLDLVATLKVRE